MVSSTYDRAQNVPVAPLPLSRRHPALRGQLHRGIPRGRNVHPNMTGSRQSLRGDDGVIERGGTMSVFDRSCKKAIEPWTVPSPKRQTSVYHHETP